MSPSGINGAVLSLEDATLLRQNGVNLLESCTLALSEGERFALEGPIGCGKSTLLWTLAGLLPLAAGHLSWFGSAPKSKRDWQAINRRVGLLMQNPDDMLVAPSVREEVAFGLLTRGFSPADANRKTDDILDEFRLSALAERAPWDLSGGQKRLVTLAAILVMDCEVLLLDEPTAGLDEETRERVLDSISRRFKSGIVVDHDEAARYFLTTHRLRFRSKKLTQPKSVSDIS
jgi:cobalt/nickel transport system ATP-binding protein